MTNKETLTISVCNIIKNEENQIGGFLENLRDFSDEIILIDTGSSDNTLGIIKLEQEKNDKIKLFNYSSSGSFHYGLAKNFSLDKATKDYCIILDTDERLSEKFKKNIHNFLITEDPVVASIVRKDELLPNLIDYPERIVRRNSGIRYGTDKLSMVHEQLHNNYPVKNFPEVVWHQQRWNHYVVRPQRIFQQLELQIDRVPKTKSLFGHIIRGIWYFFYRFKKIYFTRHLYKDGMIGLKYSFMRSLDAFIIEFFVGLKPTKKFIFKKD